MRKRKILTRFKSQIVKRHQESEVLQKKVMTVTMMMMIRIPFSRSAMVGPHSLGADDSVEV